MMMMTYSPGDALFGKGRRVKRGDTGIVGAVSNDLRGNNGDDSIELLFEWFVLLYVYRVIVDGGGGSCVVVVMLVVWTGINPLWKWLKHQKDKGVNF